MQITGTHRTVDAATTVDLLAEASNIMVVPGYGLCVAKAQYPIAELCTLLVKHGKKVRFGIHPVAGTYGGGGGDVGGGEGVASLRVGPAEYACRVALSMRVGSQVARRVRRVSVSGRAEYPCRVALSIRVVSQVTCRVR